MLSLLPVVARPLVVVLRLLLMLSDLLVMVLRLLAMVTGLIVIVGGLLAVMRRFVMPAVPMMMVGVTVVMACVMVMTDRVVVVVVGVVVVVRRLLMVVGSLIVVVSGPVVMIPYRQLCLLLRESLASNGNRTNGQGAGNGKSGHGLFKHKIASMIIGGISEPSSGCPSQVNTVSLWFVGEIYVTGLCGRQFGAYSDKELICENARLRPQYKISLNISLN